MNEIKKKLSFLYKNLIKLLFIILYGKIIFCKNPEKEKNISIEEVNDENLKDADNLKYSIYKIKNGRIFNDFVENVAIISGNKIIDKVSYQQVRGEFKDANHNSVLYRGTPYFKKKIKGRVLSLTQGASGHKNYFHWLYDILPKINIYSKNYNLREVDYLYISNLEAYQKSTLEILGYDDLKIIDSNKNRHIQADEVFCTEHPWYKKGFILKEAKKLPEWIVKWISDIFINHGKQFNSNEKIFIDRSESAFSHCQLVNNEEIINFLKNKGFTNYKVGQLSFQEQIYLFNNAKIIIGPHGAAFANLAFCKKDTKIIEIKPKNHPNFVDQHISKIKELDFNLIETDELRNRDENGDIFLDTTDLKKFL
tara:strand:- start:2400 stop:3497 length:1098 start_codon:yes stop_codon:yes gene_type:complete